FLLRQALGEFLAQPFLGNQYVEKVVERLEILEVQREGAVELVVVALVLDQRGAREQVKVVDAAEHDVLVQPFQQRQQLLDGDRNAPLLEGKEKVQKHLATLLPARHERQTFQQMHVLLVLQQGAVQGRDRLGGIALLEDLVGDIVGQQQLEPVHQFRS